MLLKKGMIVIMRKSYTTNRLILRLIDTKDTIKVLSFYNRNRDHFEPWEQKRSPNFYTYNYQYTSLSLENELINKKKLLRFWIFPKENPNLIIGTINFYNITKGCFSNCQIGYKIDREYLGMGYAFESIKYALKVLKDEHKLHRIEARIMPSNINSIKLIEKLNFNNEGLARSSIKINGEWEDHFVYAYVEEG